MIFIEHDWVDLFRQNKPMKAFQMTQRAAILIFLEDFVICYYFYLCLSYFINRVLLGWKRNTDYIQSSEFIVSLIKDFTV